MTRNEKSLESLKKQLEKAYASLERYNALLEKKTAFCIKHECNWTQEEWVQHRDSVNDKQYIAHFEKAVAESSVEDMMHRIATFERNLAKLEGTVRIEHEKDEIFQTEVRSATDKELEWLRQKSKEEYEAWLVKFKADCLKDGIIIDAADAMYFSGKTKSGKQFSICINDGVTERSFHCYSLHINGRIVFTSGEFWTAYWTIKRS